LRRGSKLGTPEIVRTDDEAPVPFGTLRPGERRALIGCAFAAGCICLMPQQLAAAAIAFVVAGLLGVWHLRRSKREEEQASKDAAHGTPSTPGEP